ncbi:hypothetical protein RQM47_16165, partial [Rubrivirga sp. S365]
MSARPPRRRADSPIRERLHALPKQTEIPYVLAESEDHLVALALALGARDVGGWSPEEEAVATAALAASGAPPDAKRLDAVRSEVDAGADPLGDALCALRSPEDRRPMGATYTPREIVVSMTLWSWRHATPARVVDPGAGSGRFLVAAGRAFDGADLVGSELDPVAAILARGHLAAAGLAAQSRVVLGDYRSLALAPISGRTLYLGNPPYVRHHLISPEWKGWLGDTARRRGLK